LAGRLLFYPASLSYAAEESASWELAHTCRVYSAVALVTLAHQPLFLKDRFCSFFRFYKSQYYFLNAIFNIFVCFDIPKMVYEQFYVTELEEMCSK
jgi:lysylphosphatidylglycerol synthetase-like protein (DUF2156 family)